MSTILTVSSVNTYVSFKLKNDPKLKGIAVKGEISDISANYSSGHIYFTLTDGTSSLKAVMFAQNAARLKFYPESGMSVIAFGGIDVYERGGIYQLNCTQLMPDGVGADTLRLAQLKDELDKLGVFSKPKKPIPKYPKIIAVVTSPSGAAIEDIRSVAGRRYPVAKILLFGATVQGITAPKSIAQALSQADLSGADTIILTRGGGSGEDLSCFNTKEAVMAVYGCKTPVISAVGHEIDTTLCDLAADLRAPTPSGAAELSTPDIAVIADEIRYLQSSIKKSMQAKLTADEGRINGFKQLIAAYSPSNRLKSVEAEIISRRSLLTELVNTKLARSERDIESYRHILGGFDPMKVISRGYALIYKNGELITSAKALAAGDNVDIVLRDGRAKSVISEVEKEN